MSDLTIGFSDASHLLYVLSARRKMSWRSFKEVFDALATTGGSTHYQPESARDGDWEGRFARRQTASVLDALAHCDFDWEEGGGRVYVAPPVLARLPRAGLPQAVLCGARSPQTYNQLEKACVAHGATVEWTEQPTSVAFVPPRVVVQAASVESLEGAARELDIACAIQPPAWELLHFSSSLDDTLGACHWAEVMDLNWRRRDFDVCMLHFRESRAQASGVQLIRYTHPRRQTRKHYVIRDGLAAIMDLDWGRYAVLESVGRNVLTYDERSFDFVVPAGAPLPRLLARSVALCSGFAPHYLPRKDSSWSSPESHAFNVYRSIPPQVAERIAEKLGQKLLKRDIRLM